MDSKAPWQRFVPFSTRLGRGVSFAQGRLPLLGRDPLRGFSLETNGLRSYKCHGVPLRESTALRRVGRHSGTPVLGSEVPSISVPQPSPRTRLSVVLKVF